MAAARGNAAKTLRGRRPVGGRAAGPHAAFSLSLTTTRIFFFVVVVVSI
jgi:hypothetical protein